MEWFRSCIRRHPRRSLVAGKTVFLVGAILVLGAVFARAQLMATNADRVNASQPAVATLREAYPQSPTWLVPEGPLGYGIAAVLVLVGTAVTSLASRR